MFVGQLFQITRVTGDRLTQRLSQAAHRRGTQTQSVVRVRPRQGHRRFQHVESADLGRRVLAIVQGRPSAGKGAHALQGGAVHAQEVGVQRHDDTRFLDPGQPFAVHTVDLVPGAASRHVGHRLVHQVTAVRETGQELPHQTALGRSQRGACHQCDRRCVAQRIHDLPVRRVPGNLLPAAARRLRAVGVVERQYRRLHRGGRGAAGDRVVGVTVDLDRPAVHRLDQQTVGPGSVRESRGVVERAAGLLVLGTVDATDDLALRFPLTALGPDEQCRRGARGQLEHVAPAQFVGRPRVLLSTRQGRLLQGVLHGSSLSIDGRSSS